MLAYVELHIEQGPMLEKMALPAGCVKSINGATRFKIEDAEVGACALLSFIRNFKQGRTA
jgi:hypothetical protein